MAGRQPHARHAVIDRVRRDAGIVDKLWHLGGKGAKCRHRPISCPAWEDIRSGYASGPREALDRLVGLTPAALAV